MAARLRDATALSLLITLQIGSSVTSAGQINFRPEFPMSPLNRLSRMSNWRSRTPRSEIQDADGGRDSVRLDHLDIARHDRRPDAVSSIRKGGRRRASVKRSLVIALSLYVTAAGALAQTPAAPPQLRTVTSAPSDRRFAARAIDGLESTVALPSHRATGRML